MRIVLPVALVALVLAGCMSSGTEVSDGAISQFVRGRTTETEVVQKLGEPNSRERNASGQMVDTYLYTSVAANAQSFIPIVGGLIASSDMKMKTVRFTFSAQGVLLDWSSSSTKQEMHNGLLNQQ